MISLVGVAAVAVVGVYAATQTTAAVSVAYADVIEYPFF